MGKVDPMKQIIIEIKFMNSTCHYNSSKVIRYLGKMCKTSALKIKNIIDRN